MRLVIGSLIAALLIAGPAAADPLDDSWQGYLSDQGQGRLSDAAQKTKLQEFVAQNYGPALQRAAETIKATAGATELRRRDELARAAIAWARPREDALGDLVLSRAYRQGLGVEANLFESLRLLRRPYQAQVPEGLEILIVALDQGTGRHRTQRERWRLRAACSPPSVRRISRHSAYPSNYYSSPSKRCGTLGFQPFLISKTSGGLLRRL